MSKQNNNKESNIESEGLHFRASELISFGLLTDTCTATQKSTLKNGLACNTVDTPVSINSPFLAKFSLQLWDASLDHKEGIDCQSSGLAKYLVTIIVRRSFSY